MHGLFSLFISSILFAASDSIFCRHYLERGHAFSVLTLPYTKKVNPKVMVQLFWGRASPSCCRATGLRSNFLLTTTLCCANDVPVVASSVTLRFPMSLAFEVSFLGVDWFQLHACCVLCSLLCLMTEPQCFDRIELQVRVNRQPGRWADWFVAGQRQSKGNP